MSLAVCGRFKEDASRPPVPGEEDHELVQFKDDGQIFRKTLPRWSEGWTAKPRRSDLDLGFEPEGSASLDERHEAWAETLLTLLDDREGTMLFQKFLTTICCSELLDFWFACSGFRKFPTADSERRLKLAKVIYRCYLSERSCSAVSRQVAMVTRFGVIDAIGRSHLDSDLFAQAHEEVQAVLEHNLFPLFLRSDVYLKHIDHLKTTQLTLSTDQQNTALPQQPDTSETDNTVDDHKKRSRRNPTTRDRNTHKHLPHKPMKMRTHTFLSKLMTRLQDLQTAKKEADVTDGTSLSKSQLMRDSSAHSLCYTEHDINTCEVKSVTHSTNAQHYGITVVYYMCGEVIPYRTFVEGNIVTLTQFKSLMTRRDPYRFFFKRASGDCGVVFEEIRDDETVLPTYDHKIIAKVERMNK